MPSRWTKDQIDEVRPGLGIAFESITGRLQQHGLIEYVDRTLENMERIARGLQDQARRQVSMARPTKPTEPVTSDPPSIGEIERSWSATAMSVLVLCYYDEAAAEAAESPAS